LWSDLAFSFWNLFGPALLTTLLIIALLSLLASRITNLDTAESAPFLASFSLLGGVSGLIAGVAQEAMVGTMLTGLLGLITAMLAYMFTVDSLVRWRPIIPLGLMGLVLAALVGLAFGGTAKKARAENDRGQARWTAKNEKVFLPAQRAELLISLCKTELRPPATTRCIEKVIVSAKE
jgi:hypothetical protein